MTAPQDREAPTMHHPDAPDPGEAMVCDFRVRVFATDPDSAGFVHFRVVLTGNITGLEAEERSPVPEWALIRCWRKLATTMREHHPWTWAAEAHLPRSTP